MNVSTSFGRPFTQAVERLLLERAPTALMYHGTGERNLKSILSRGLLPKGVPKTWATDPAASFIQPSRVSLGGIYLSHNLMTSVSASFRGTDIRGGERRMIVVAQIQPRSLFADEDDFAFSVGSLGVRGKIASAYQVVHLFATQSGQGRVNSSGWVRDYASWRKDWVREKLDVILSGLRNSPHPSLQRRVEDILDEGFAAVVSRLASHATRNLSPGTLLQVASERGVETIHLPSKAEGEADFRVFTRQLTKTLKVFAQKDARRDRFSVSGRLMRPLGFRGVNKIVAIFLFFDALSGQGTETKTVFGRVPQETIAEWNSRMGRWVQSAA